MKTKTFLKNFKLFNTGNLLMETSFRDIERNGINLISGEKKKISLGRQCKLRKSLINKSFFDEDVRVKAKKMSEFYELYFSIENTIRKLISEKLTMQAVGQNWWNSNYIPQNIIDEVKKRMDEEKQESMEVRSDDPLAYTNFGEFIPIFEKNWQYFSDTLRTRESMRKTLGQLNKLRNVIAHSCELTEDDIIRFELAIRDWFLRVQT